MKRELVTATALGRDVPVRIFRPGGHCRGVILDFHGGGWTIGNARMSDRQNAKLAAETAATVVSVDYRLATSIPIDAQVDDCEAATLWVVANLEPKFGTRQAPATSAMCSERSNETGLAATNIATPIVTTYAGSARCISSPTAKRHLKSFRAGSFITQLTR